MDKEQAIKLIDRLIEEISAEINAIKSQIAYDITMQVAIYAHDHIEANRMDFAVLSKSPRLDDEDLQELTSGQIEATLLDREQRRNALKHLKHLIASGNTEALQLLQGELQRFFRDDEAYDFLSEPSTEHPNEHVKPYPYRD